MDFNDFVEIIPLLCLTPILLIVAVLLVYAGLEIAEKAGNMFLAWRRNQIELDGLRLANQRIQLDLPLVTVQNGLHRMPVARTALVSDGNATELVARAIETTRTKPLDNLTSLGYSPRVSNAASVHDSDMQEATEALSELLGGAGGELNMNGVANTNGTGNRSNGYAKHG